MRIRLLGAVEAWPDGTGGDRGPVPLGGLRLRGLLARLALDAGRPVGTAVLVDDLWGGSPPDGAGNALQALVSRLRRAIGPELVATEASGYRLRIDPRDVDALRFGELVTAAGSAAPPTAHRSLREALALWRGPALADVAELPFAGPAAARLTDRRASAVEQSARIALGTGEPEHDALAAQLDADPLRESTAALLARGLHAAGRQADALAVLDRTAARLATELGVDPGPEMAAARLAVLRGEVVPVHHAAPPPAPRPAPASGALSSFVGRAGDVDRIRTLLAGARLVTLTGPGGAGKTRLAREAVASGGTPGTPRLHVAELAALTQPDQLPATLLSAVGGAELLLGSPDETEQDTTVRLVSALSGREVLLLLDNCEHLVGAVATLAENLLGSCPQLRVLATSREPLGVPGEVLHPVDALPRRDAVRLFADRAAAVSPGFVLSPAVEPVVMEICRRLDGQPLPIELAAARLRTLSPAEIAARLDDRFRLLTSGARTALPRHQTLRAVVDWSWDLLAEPERAVARRLGAFAGGATAAAAERVCAGPAGPAPEEVFDLLAALVDKSLVVAVPQADGSGTRYRMLETIREYAAERLDEAGERPAAVAAHARFVLELTEAEEPRLRRAEQLDALARLRAEADEIDLALRRAVESGDAETAHRLVAAMAWAWVIRGLMEDASRWVRAVQPLDGPAPPAARALNRAFMAMLCVGEGHVEDATEQFGLAKDLAATVPAPRHPLLELLEPGFTLFAASDPEPIRLLSIEATDPWVRAFALQLLAGIAGNDGLIDEQRSLVRAAHAQFVELGDRFGLGMVVHALGELEELTGGHDAAARAYDEAIALATELGNEDDLPQFLTRRAMLDARRGDLGAARARLDRALEQGEGPFATTGAVRTAYAYVAYLERDFAAARVHLDAAEQAIGHGGLALPQRLAHLAMSRTVVEVAAGEPARARDALRSATTAGIDSKDGPITAAVADAAAQLALAEGDPECAGTLLGIAATHRGAVDLGNPDVVAAHAALRTALGADAAERAVRRGRELSKEDGTAMMREFADRPAATPGDAPGRLSAAGARAVPRSAPRGARGGSR